MFAALIVLTFTTTLAANLPDQEAEEVGPCTILKNGMKCTSKGYFETVQCDLQSCFCVMAHNGYVDENSRTTSKMIKPNCTHCYNTLERIYAFGQPADMQHILLCNNKTGEFADQLCDNAPEQTCWCVDPKTGIERPGTRARLHKYFHCGFKTDSEPRFALAKSPDLPKQVAFPVGSPDCKLPKSAGTTCKNGTKSVKFYFDVASAECLAFKFNGCGGNKNSFKSKNECRSVCYIPDLSGCAGMIEAARDKTCGVENPDCPQGFKCRMGAFFGYCCPEESEEGQLVNNTQSEWNEALLGKSCVDNFCPQRSTCIEGEIFAHCCT